MRALNLQKKITLVTAAILAACSVAITAASMVNAGQSFVALEGGSDIETAAAVGVEVGVAVDDSATDGIAAPTTPSSRAEETSRQFNATSIVVCTVVVALGSLLTYAAAGRALRPLRKLTETVSSIDAGSLDQRVVQPQGDDEAARIARAFNFMLERLEGAFLQERRFAANAAHELKTPLAIMKTNDQVFLADENATKDDLAEALELNLESASRLSAVVDDLLLLARSDSGEASLRWDGEVTELDPLIEAVAAALAPLMDARGMSISWECGRVAAAVDPSRAYRMVFALVENACKYGRMGGRISIAAEEDGSEIRLTVADDGPGIPEEHREHLFDAFYRIDGSRARETGGAGLGLSIVRALAEASGGRAFVASADEGACFVVVLPNAGGRSS